MAPTLLLKVQTCVFVLRPQRLSAERNTSDSDSVGVSTAENGRENGETKKKRWTPGPPTSFFWQHLSHSLHQRPQYALLSSHNLISGLLTSCSVGWMVDVCELWAFMRLTNQKGCTISVCNITQYGLDYLERKTSDVRHPYLFGSQALLCY